MPYLLLVFSGIESCGVVYMKHICRVRTDSPATLSSLSFLPPCVLAFSMSFSSSENREKLTMIAELTKSGNLSMREILVVTSAYARPPARTDSGGGGWESQGNQTGGEECHLF